VTLRISAGDIAGKTVSEIFADKGYLKETPELIAAYVPRLSAISTGVRNTAHSFQATGTGFYAEDPSSTQRNTDWSRKDVVVLSANGTPARLVNDESIIPNRTTALDVTGTFWAST